MNIIFETEDYEVIFCENDFPYFLIKTIKLEPHFINFEVYEVISWNMDPENSPSEAELYVEGTIKWDGCSHVWFGEKQDEGSRDGYIHLCGKDYWERHAKVMMKIYEYAAGKIENYDKTVAE